MSKNRPENVVSRRGIINGAALGIALSGIGPKEAGAALPPKSWRVESIMEVPDWLKKLGAPADSCLACHKSYAAVAERTKGRIINPHKIPFRPDRMRLVPQDAPPLRERLQQVPRLRDEGTVIIPQSAA